MLRASLALVALVASLPAVAAPSTIYRSTFRGDGFDAGLGASDGCFYVDAWFSGSDYSTKSQPGAPQQSNYLYGYVNVFDCNTQGWGSAYIEQANATMAANGVNGTSTVSTTVNVAFGHWEPSEEQQCYTYEEWCWEDENGEIFCEPAGEYCYPLYWTWVDDGTQELALSLSIAGTGDTFRGMQVTNQKSPWAIYRSRYTGSSRYATVTGTATLNGENILSNEYSWSYGSVWTTTAGTQERWEF